MSSTPVGPADVSRRPAAPAHRRSHRLLDRGGDFVGAGESPRQDARNATVRRNTTDAGITFGTPSAAATCRWPSCQRRQPDAPVRQPRQRRRRVVVLMHGDHRDAGRRPGAGTPPSPAAPQRTADTSTPTGSAPRCVRRPLGRCRRSRRRRGTAPSHRAATAAPDRCRPAGMAAGQLDDAGPAGPASACGAPDARAAGRAAGCGVAQLQRKRDDRSPRPRPTQRSSSGSTWLMALWRVTARPAPAGGRFPGPSPARRRFPVRWGPVRTTGSPWPARRPRRPVAWRGRPAGRGRSRGG